MSKCSPGPWRWGREEESTDHILFDANGDVVLDGEALTQQSGWGRSTNRRLVAKAPELLEALRALLAHEFWSGLRGEHDGMSVDAAYELIESIEGDE